MSRDEATGTTSAQKVTQTFEKQAAATLVLRLKNGETIETTPEHPFYVESQGFTPAGEMGIGTSIVTRAGPSAVLASSQVRERTATVYNFEVENTQTRLATLLRTEPQKLSVRVNSRNKKDGLLRDRLFSWAKRG